MPTYARDFLDEDRLESSDGGVDASQLTVSFSHSSGVFACKQIQGEFSEGEQETGNSGRIFFIIFPGGSDRSNGFKSKIRRILVLIGQETLFSCRFGKFF